LQRSTTIPGGVVHTADVLIAGAGPAGRALAAAGARRGLQVHLVAPAPAAPWPQTYGAWLDELEVSGRTGAVARRWDRVLVRTIGPAFRSLDRTYCLLDNAALASQLRAEAATASVTADRVTGVAVRDDHLVVTTGSGATLAARAVVDATGHPPALGPGPGQRLAWQTAYGQVATFTTPPAPPGSMCFMDFDASPFDGDGPATFLYAMDLGGGRWLVEETALAGRPGVPIATLRERLARRLAARGTPPIEVHTDERVAFAMDAPLPPAGPVVAFGAAAAMVHPATGYQVAAALASAPPVAAALAWALDCERDVRRVARAAQHAVWPRSAVRRDALYRLGLDVLLDLDVAQTQAFFDAFFALPAEAWQGYVSRTSSPGGIQRTMGRLMLGLPGRVRARVLRTSLATGSWPLLARAVAPALAGR
jgi:lycopene beta-cyclase